jgi:dethiobiotin synthetase
LKCQPNIVYIGLQLISIERGLGMNHGIFITGTDTGVGKTQIAAGLAAVIRQKIKHSVPFQSKTHTVQLWKPVQTGTQLGQLEADSYRLASLSGLGQAEHDIVSYTYPEPLAPMMAAKRFGEMPDYNALVREGKRRQKETEFLIVEGAGGLAVPLTFHHLMTDLMNDMKLPILIVARPGLGTVNHTLLTAAYARQAGLEVLGIIINGYKPEETLRMKENVEMIEGFSEEKVLGCVPWFTISNLSSSIKQQWIQVIEQHVDIDKLMDKMDGA